MSPDHLLGAGGAKRAISAKQAPAADGQSFRSGCPGRRARC